MKSYLIDRSSTLDKIIFLAKQFINLLIYDFLLSKTSKNFYKEFDNQSLLCIFLIKLSQYSTAWPFPVILQSLLFFFCWNWTSELEWVSICVRITALDKPVNKNQPELQRRSSKVLEKRFLKSLLWAGNLCINRPLH